MIVDSFRVLVVDDCEVNRIVLSKMLSKDNFDVACCDNGKDAIEKIVSKHYDIVLMDLHMPIMGGIEVVKVIRSLTEEYYKNLPIIGLSATIFKNEIKEMFLAGYNDYQSKPFTLEELMAKISIYLPLETR